MQGRRIERVQSQLPHPQTSPDLPGHNPEEHQPLDRMMSEKSHHYNPAAHPRSQSDAGEKGSSLSNLSARSNSEPHDFIILRALAVVGPESREADESGVFS